MSDQSMRGKPPFVRVLARIQIDPVTTCWVWPGAKTTVGYGVLRIDGKYNQGVHRIIYEHFVGPIPDGLQIDHLCEVRACCNPAHLEAVTQRENLLRGNTVTARNAAATHCPQGHEYTAENVYAHPRGWRSCKLCGQERDRARSPRRHRSS